MRSSVRLSLPLLATTMLLGACGGSSYGGSSSSANPSAASVSGLSPGSAVRTAINSSLGATVLVDQHGLTLYRLSGEQAGRFICTADCLKVWHPLTLSAGGKPGSAVSSLGSVTRPDGETQVTYCGMPLYTFTQDQSPGQIKGQGIKDVGTWNAVSTGAAKSAKATAPSSPKPYGGGGSAY